MSATTSGRTGMEVLGAGTVSILGLPWDRSSSFLRGAAEAPDRIRRSFRSPAGNTCAEDGTDLAVESRLVDLGDLDFEPIAPGAGSAVAAVEMVERVASGAGAILATGARLFALGGDHSVTYPLARAQSRAHENLWLVHFDAHPDLYDDFEGDRLSHACPFARIMDEGLLAGLTQVGIRTATPHQRHQAARFGVEMHPPGTPAVEAWAKVEGPVYVSFDLDALDPAFAPGVSHPEPGGLSVREAIDLLRAIPGPVVGADVVELNPKLDPIGLTAGVAAKLFKEMASRMLADSLL